MRKIINKILSFYYYASNNCFMREKNTEKIKYKKRIYICTLAWGEYIDWYFSFSLPALMNSSNIGALIRDGFDVRIVLQTTKDKNYIMKKYINDIDFDNIPIEVNEYSKEQCSSAKEANVQHVVDLMRRCVEEKAMFYHSPPDNIMGNGSLYNAVTSSFGKNKCFASAYGRTSLDIIDEITPYPKEGIKNDKMVRLCMKFATNELKSANEDLSKNTTYLGISYRELSKGLYAISHSLPSAYLVFPIKEDYEYFEKVQDYNMWDRGWLEILIKTNRLKISGSSDLFFCFELTPNSSIESPRLRDGLRYNDKIVNPEFHNKVSNMFTSIWRSDIYNISKE
jgi:hypothetical protein